MLKIVAKIALRNRHNKFGKRLAKVIENLESDVLIIIQKATDGISYGRIMQKLGGWGKVDLVPVLESLLSKGYIRKDSEKKEYDLYFEK